MVFATPVIGFGSPTQCPQLRVERTPCGRTADQPLFSLLFSGLHYRYCRF
jgi:hypothetical protein